jgi:predicted small secreted protein
MKSFSSLRAIKISMLMIFVATSLVSAGCSTIEGMGKDLQNLGKAMEKKDGSNESSNSSNVPPVESAVTTPIK